MAIPHTPSRESRVLTGIFLVALAAHLWGVTYNWTTPLMVGHEFRQAQTAITTYYIDRQNNFGLLYETPVLGKPWVSILLEVPLYEWSVVAVSRLAGVPHIVAARGVSIACFYLMLPAIYLLLARLGLTRPRRLLALALVLTCPVYIYYTRAFLMDSMALMFAAWFLLGFVRTMDERRWTWLAVAIVAGTAAGLVKSAVLAVWLLPAAGYGAWMLWRDIRTAGNWRAPARTVLWGVATIAVAMGALRWWIVYTDPLKAAHDSAWIFTSKNLVEGNWGLFNLKPLFSTEILGDLLNCWDQAVMSRWLIGLGLIVGLCMRGSRRATLGVGGLFFAAQAMFPLAYAYQDYYFYTCAIFLNVAFGFVLFALMDSQIPRWICALGFAVPFVAQVVAYRQDYWNGQKARSEGGYPFSNAIRDLTPKNSVIVTAGFDWAAMTPLYSQRKALMVRNGLEFDTAYLNRAFGRLADEDVSAVVVTGNVRTERNFIDLAAQWFDFDPTVPSFSWQDTDVYIPRIYRRGVQMAIRASKRYPQLVLSKAEDDDLAIKSLIKISPAVGRDAFGNFVPSPYQMKFQFGLSWLDLGQGEVLSAHPNTDFWLRPPANATKIHWSYGIFPGAYASPSDRTDGVEFIIDGERPDGSTRRIYRRLLDPVRNPGDRGDQRVTIPYSPQPEESLRFSTRPNKSIVFDWAYWIAIKVE
jgi:Dolichyl-phosphate-mannose-protein mannosyltransferase